MYDYYKLLDLPRTASEEEIEKARKEKVRIWRNRENSPDISVRHEAEQAMKQLGEVRDILLSPSKRAEYDSQLAAYGAHPEPTSTVPQDSSAQEQMQQGWDLLGQGNVGEALLVANRIVQLDPSSPQVWAFSAQAKYRWGDYDDAVYEYKRAISLAPNQSRYYFDLGCVYEAKQKWEDALQQFRRASVLEPQTTMYKAAIAGVYVSQEKYAEGIEILEHCVQEEPNSKNYRVLLFSAYLDASYRNWTFYKGDYYATEKRHITEAELYIDKAEKLLSSDPVLASDPELKSALQSTRENVTGNLRRKFVGNVATMIIASLVWGLFTAGWGLLLLAPLYYLSCRIPQYSVNIRVIASEMSEDYKDIDFGSMMASQGCFGIILVIVAFPIMIVINFIRNYTGDNAT